MKFRLFITKMPLFISKVIDLSHRIFIEPKFRLKFQFSQILNNPQKGLWNSIGSAKSRIRWSFSFRKYWITIVLFVCSREKKQTNKLNDGTTISIFSKIHRKNFNFELQSESSTFFCWPIHYYYIIHGMFIVHLVQGAWFECNRILAW